MHSSQLEHETEQLGNSKQRYTYMMGVAQEQQHSSDGDAGGPYEAPLVALATLPLACVFLGWATTGQGGTTQQNCCRIFVGGCMHSSQLQGETTAQLGNTKQTHIHDEGIGQLRQHSSSTAATERLDGGAVSSDHTKVKVDSSDASLKNICKMHLAHHLKRQL